MLVLWVQKVMDLPDEERASMAAVVDFSFRLHSVHVTEKHKAVTRQVFKLACSL